MWWSSLLSWAKEWEYLGDVTVTWGNIRGKKKGIQGNLREKKFLIASDPLVLHLGSKTTGLIQPVYGCSINESSQPLKSYMLFPASAFKLRLFVKIGAVLQSFLPYDFSPPPTYFSLSNLLFFYLEYIFWIWSSTVHWCVCLKVHNLLMENILS